ncbi:MAG: two-component system, OmpR family, phosphate regulon sensor histidine kinase PhoR [Desulfobacteraceae bacterium Eth-SRB1]|nr:MAG: two-component system, OmpR family, phosphate regulon sensor histidine kinase PhoR [Desulfobacteraceae bacterium Eth-SRB1]
MKKKKRLISQLYPSYLLIVFISLTAVSWYASDAMRNFFFAQTADVLETRTKLLESRIIKHLSPLNEKSVDLTCKEIGGISETRITVVLPSGKVIGDSEEDPRSMDNHSDRKEVRAAISGNIGDSTRFSRTLQQKMMYVAIPLIKDNKILGVLRISIPVTSVDNALKSIQRKIALGGLFIALLAAIISLFVARRISEPLEEMKKSADRFAEGDLAHRLPVPDTKEMEALGEAMNQMAAQLDSRIKSAIRRKNELETVLSSMLEGVIAVDMDERIISVNQVAAMIFNGKPEKFKGQSIQEAIRVSELQRFVKRALLSVESIEDDIVLEHNEERVLNMHSSSLQDAEKKRAGILVVINDVTKLRRLENVRRDFVANVSHEIKTPLTAIKGFVETLHDGTVEKPEDIERFFEIIIKHINRLDAIVEDLLTLSKIEQEDTGEKEIKFETGSIKDVLETAIQVCQAKADKKNIHIKSICDKGITTRIDPALLDQAIVNILDNAIKYSEKESAVYVECSSMEKEIIISIKDQGIGITKKHLPRLFERFYRVDKARSRELGGTGLGLAIAKHIVQTHGGRISVESTPGKGSAFTIHLPSTN